MKTAPESRLVVTARTLWEYRKPLFFAVCFVTTVVTSVWRTSSAQDRVMKVERLLVTVPAYTVAGRVPRMLGPRRPPMARSPRSDRLEITHPDLPEGFVAIEPDSWRLGSGDPMKRLEERHRATLAKLFREGVDRPTVGPGPWELGDRKAYGASWTTPDGTERTVVHLKAGRRDAAILQESIPPSTTPKAQTAARLLKGIKHSLTIER